MTLEQAKQLPIGTSIIVHKGEYEGLIGYTLTNEIKDNKLKIFIPFNHDIHRGNDQLLNIDDIMIRER